MPTDKEKFVALMAEFGVPLHPLNSGKPEEDVLSIKADDKDTNPKVNGYYGFEANFVFNTTTGAFITVGIWE